MKTVSSINHSNPHTPKLTNHAAVRMQQRAISHEDIDTTLTYGRFIQTKGATFCVIGHKEVQHYASIGIDLSLVKGVQVLLGDDGEVITVYRSHDLHAIKASGRPRHYH